MPQLLAILPDEHAWSICIDEAGACRWETLPIEDAATPGQQAAALLAWLDAQRVGRQRPLLVLPSRACFSATIRTDGLLRKSRRQGMLFRLEEFLPLEAEAMAADFVMHAATALGVAVDARQWRPLVDALTEVGIPTSTMMPLATLVLEQLTRQEVIAEADAVALVGPAGTDLLVLQQGKPSHWYWCPRDANVLRSHLARLASATGATSPLRLLRVDASPSDAATPPDVDDNEQVQAVSPPDLPSTWELAATAARAIGAQGQAPLLDLRRGPLAPRRWQRWEPLQRQLTAVVAALILLCVCIAAAGAWRTHRTQLHIAQLQDQQVQVFRGAFPGQSPPAAILARFQSEARRLRGTAADGQSLPRRGDAVGGFYEVLGNLPANLRFRVLELRLDGGRVYLEGQARSHGDAETIAAALARSPRLTLEPARTENLPDLGVAFTLTGLLQPTEAHP